MCQSASAVNRPVTEKRFEGPKQKFSSVFGLFVIGQKTGEADIRRSLPYRLVWSQGGICTGAVRKQMQGLNGIG